MFHGHVYDVWVTGGGQGGEILLCPGIPKPSQGARTAEEGLREAIGKPPLRWNTKASKGRLRRRFKEVSDRLAAGGGKESRERIDRNKRL